MRSLPRLRSSLALGATLFTIAACRGGNDDNTATAGGETTPGAAAPAPGTEGVPVVPGTPGTASADSMATANRGAMNADLSGLATMSPADQMAILGASNAAEILTSEAAQPKLQNPGVKAYARRMITEHRAMQKQADQLATRLNVTPGSPELATSKARMANQVAQELKAAPASTASNGAQYADRQFIDGQVLAHQQTLAELQAMQGTQNAEIGTLVKQAIPKVQAHLDEAKRLQQQLATGNAGANNGMNNGGVGVGGAQGSTSSSSPQGAVRP